MKTTQNQNLLAAALTCALASVATVAQADDLMATPATTPTMAPAAGADADAWQFGATIPLWAPAINGTATAFGHQRDVNVNFSELKEHLDTSLGLALSAQKGKFGIYGNVGYMKFSASPVGPTPAGVAQFNFGLKFVMANAGVSYLLLKTDEEHPFMLAGTAGLRYWYTDTRLEITDPNHGQAVLFPTHDSYLNVEDPVIGLRASKYLTSKLHLDISGDGGGFNINNSTDWTWSAAGMVSYDFTKWFTLSAGYQAVALDELNGSGTSEKGVNLVFQGVAGGLTFKF